MDRQVAWKPHSGSQQLFLSCPYDELLYHGTRGGGKTDALLMDYARDVGRGYGEAWRGILFRQTFKQLADVVQKSLKWYPRIFPSAQFARSDYTWHFPQGETLLLRYMDKPDDYWHYHGHEYPWQGWEELTNWPAADCYEMMMACNRSSSPGVPRRIRATCNPWGPGHAWVKSRFVDAVNQGQAHTRSFLHPLTGEEITTTRGHIFGHLFENKALLRSDPEYLAKLKEIKDEQKRKAWLTGDWNIVAGGFFSSVFEETRHVIREPWVPPRGWRCYASFDWGSASPFSVGFWCESNGEEAPDGNFYPKGALIRFDEWYGAKEENGKWVGLHLPNYQIGAGIASRMAAYQLRGLRFSVGPADPSIFKEDGGPSIYSQVRDGARRELFSRADNTRVAGWQRMVELLEGEPDRGPLLYVMGNCRHWLRTVPVLPRDERDFDDVDTRVEDHCADESRYMSMWKPKEAKVIKLLGR